MGFNQLQKRNHLDLMMICLTNAGLNGLLNYPYDVTNIDIYLYYVAKQSVTYRL